MKRKRGQSEMADTKYLFKRGGVWAIRFRLPDRFAREKVFQRSLGTGDITAARKFRDLHVMPFLAGEDLYTATSALVDKAIRLRIEQDQRFGKLKGLLLPGAEPDSGALSLRALAGAYLAFVRKGKITPSTVQAYNSHLEGFLRLVGEQALANKITKREITAYRDRLLSLPLNWLRLKELPSGKSKKKNVSPAQVGNALALVKGMFEWAIDEGKIELTTNPVDGVKPPKIGKSARRGFSNEEVDRACALPMPPNAKSFDAEAWTSLPVIARYTGARLGEIAQLNGRGIVEVQGVWCLRIYENLSEGRTTKTHGERFVPIASKIRPLVLALKKKNGDGPLLPKTGTWKDEKFGVIKPAKAFGNAFQQRVKQIAPDLSFHAFRHYAITAMANAGVPQEVRERIVGHRSDSAHQGYTKIDVSVMAQAVETIY